MGEDGGGVQEIMGMFECIFESVCVFVSACAENVWDNCAFSIAVYKVLCRATPQKAMQLVFIYHEMAEQRL